MRKRITVTIDETLLERALAAVAEGRAESVSGWVSDAMVERAEKDRRLAALAELIADYEAEFGAITDEEMDEQEQSDRDAAAAARAQTRRAG